MYRSLANFCLCSLNGLFVLGRSIGFIGHYLDQKLLKQPLYRHPADDIFISLAGVNSADRVLV
jgi:ATP citrate (pro-S)-lyase